MSDDYQQAEGPGGSLGRQPWANNPRSMTDTGPAYQLDDEPVVFDDAPPESIPPSVPPGGLTHE
jgi:hypothetical protein